METIVVLLVGPQGAGKSTYCGDHLSDFLRISQDGQGPNRHFELYLEALQRNEPRIVVDRTNGQQLQRKRYLDPARQYGYPTKIVWLNVDREECARRCRERVEHPTLKLEDVDRAIGNFFCYFDVPQPSEADELEIK